MHNQLKLKEEFESLMLEKPLGIQMISFPYSRKADWQKHLSKQLKNYNPGQIDVNTLDWPLNCKDLEDLIRIFSKHNLKINLIRSNIPLTLVSASSVGIQTFLDLKQTKGEIGFNNKVKKTKEDINKVTFEQGTLRSGEHLESDNDLIFLGDINPGAKISSAGNVMIWGRLLGVAHAGTNGNQYSKITALELRPLQLRIAGKVARGPEGRPEPGLAEEAVIKSGQIVIQPACCNGRSQ